MDKVIKKILFASGAAVGAAGIASVSAYITTRYLVNTALDREPPKMMKKASEKIAGSHINKDFIETIQTAAQVLENKDNELVKIMSHDNETQLVGHFINCPNSKRIVIAFHGWRSSWCIDFGTVADFWYNNNCSVLYVEQRGQNSSGGEYMGFGLTERYDCLDWINWTVNRFGNSLPIYLAGVSMGATTVLMASGLDLPTPVHGIFADCGFTSPNAIWKYVAQKNLHIGYGLRSAIADAICKEKINIGANEYSTVVDALKNCKVPVMFVHGTDDHFVPIKMTYENYLACAAPKYLLVIPGADHAMSHFVEPKRYESAVMEFWKKYD